VLENSGGNVFDIVRIPLLSKRINANRSLTEGNFNMSSNCKWQYNYSTANLRKF